MSLSHQISTIRIGFAGFEPFVMAGDEAQGIAPDIWKEISIHKTMALFSLRTVNCAIP